MKNKKIKAKVQVMYHKMKTSDGNKSDKRELKLNNEIKHFQIQKR